MCAPDPVDTDLAVQQASRHQPKLIAICQVGRPIEPPARPPALKRLRGGDPEPSAQELNGWLKAAGSSNKVLQLVDKHHHLFDAIHSATALSQLAKAPRGEQQAAQQHQAWPVLLITLDSQAEALTARGVSSVVWSLTKLRLQPEPARLLDRLLVCAYTLLQQSDAQSLSNLLYAVAAAGRNPGEAFLTAFEQQLHRMLKAANAQDLSNVLWAFARLEHQLSTQSANSLLQRYTEVIQEATPQGISNVLWASGTLALQPSSKLLTSSAERLLALLPSCSAQNVSNALWAFGKHSAFPGTDFMTAAVAFLTQRLEVRVPSSLLLPTSRLLVLVLCRCVKQWRSLKRYSDLGCCHTVQDKASCKQQRDAC